MGFKKYLKENEDVNYLNKYLPILKEMVGLINMQEIINFLNEKDYDYINMNDLEMIIKYIELNNGDLT